MSANAQAVTGKKSTFWARALVLLGAACVSLWAVGTMAQIQTNEAFITGIQTVNIFHPDWSILWQIPDLVQGKFDATEGMAVLFGWTIEIVYLIFITGYEIAILAVQDASGQRAARWFRTLSYFIVIFDGWTDYQFGTLGQWGHLGAALIMAFVVGFLGTIGMKLVEIGWSHA